MPLGQKPQCEVKFSCIKNTFDKGFTLIEVLISVFILAVGLLGLASLQINSLRYNQESSMRSIAVMQMNEIVDRMRANAQGVQAGSYNNASGIPTKPSCTTCTSAQIATNDIYTWNTENNQLLPSGQGIIANVGTNLFDITIRWDSYRTGATGTNCSGNPNVDLTCLTVRVGL